MDTSDDFSGDSYSERSASGSSLTAAFLGLVLTAASFAGLFWNEGRAVTTARSLAEGAGLVASVDAERFNVANAGRLIHVAGKAEVGAPVADDEFGVSVLALRLVRVVEMYQWKEERTKNGDSTAYTYSRVWKEGRIDSGNFKRPSGHSNPEPLFKRRAIEADDVQLGEFRPGHQVLAKLSAREGLPASGTAAELVRSRIGRSANVVDGKVYVGADPGAPQIGDLRISWKIVRPGPISIVGAQSDRDFAPFQTRAGDKLLLVHPGIVSAEQMFADAKSMNTLLTWALRAVGALVMWLGCMLVLRPLTALFENIPLIGSVVEAGAGLAALLFTLIFAPLTIAVAWFYYRPLVSLIVLAGGAALAFALGQRMGGRATAGAAAPVRPSLAPQRSFLPPQAMRQPTVSTRTSFLPRGRAPGR